MKRFPFLLIIIIVCLAFSAQKTNAQFPQTESVDELIKVVIVPETPRQNQDVNISIESYSYDLSRSRISWYLNDKLRDSGMGKTSFNFTTGKIGSASNIRYLIKTVDGKTFEKSVSISPGDVSLLWESTGYTPPFFKGKSLFSFEGQIRFIAIPNLLKSNGVKYKPEELVYTWHRGMGTDTDASGYGKNTFYWNGNVISSPEEILVEVSDLENTTKASASIVMSPKETEIFAYENSPALGILFNKVINGNFNLSGSEVSFTAVPYYFNSPDADGIYSWYVNGNQSPETTKYITFRNTSNAEGYSKIDFDLSNQKRIMQSANSSFNIIMGSASNTVSGMFKSLFGN